LPESVSFDRAASYYDRTRSLSEPVMAKLIAMLSAEIGTSGRCLEIGVGTGRIALPLARAGMRMVGVDISREMLGRLADNAQQTPVGICLADATRLPFPQRCFDSAIAAHVLHLVPRWREAVDELVRVVRPGGKILAERGGKARGDWWHEVRRRFFAEAGNPPWPPGLDRVEVLDDLMRSRGAGVRAMPELVDAGNPTANDLLSALETGIWSACWTIDEATRKRAAASARAWATVNLGDLDEPRPVSEVLTWRVYELP
jgi:ubiquinone/menaquinone biosynthesis C-methylase UbiE